MEMTKFSAAGLPATTSLAASLRGIQGAGNAGNAGNVVFMRFDKLGHWTFGSEQTEVETDSEWAINPYSFNHGFLAWVNGSPTGSVLVPVADPLPNMGAVPDGAKNGWQFQLGVQMKCLSGEDAGLECVYSSATVGGVRALQALGLEIAGQSEKDAENFVPVVLLRNDFYMHKDRERGKIMLPVLKHVRWASVHGEAPTPEPEAEPVEEPAARRRQRRV